MPTQIPASGIAAGAITAEKIAGSVALGGPKITGIDYPGDDTAALPAGGQTIIINGTGFESGCTVFLEGSAVGVVSFVSSSQLQFVAPAKSTGLYPLYVVNPDGGTAIGVPGLVYSGTPTWTTASGSLGTPYETASFSVSLSATGDGALSYAVASGSSIPSGLTLASNGTLSGTVPVTAVDTTYTFNVDVIDSENQSTTRQFSVTYRTDVVTWSSPNAGASFSWKVGTANSTSLVATSAAGKSVSFSVQSGSLPANVTVSGNSISGNPNTVSSNTSVIIRATAADTNRYADRTLYFNVTGTTTITNATYLQSFSLDGQEARDIKFSSDGTQMYVIDDANGSGVLRQYTLSTPWNVTTASFTRQRTMSSLGGDGYGVAFTFSADGTKLFWYGYANWRIFRHDLSTAWDISSAGSLVGSYYSLSSSGGKRGLQINPTGTKIFVIETNYSWITEYTLSTPYVVSTATETGSGAMAPSNSPGFAFTDNGEKVFTASYTNSEVREYSLSTPYTISTASFVANTTVVKNQTTVLRSLAFSSSGSYMYAAGGYPGVGQPLGVWQYTL